METRLDIQTKGCFYRKPKNSLFCLLFTSNLFEIVKVRSNLHKCRNYEDHPEIQRKTQNDGSLCGEYVLLEKCSIWI